MQRTIIALVTACFAVTAHAQNSPDINGSRTDKSQGASGYIRGQQGRNSETIGGRGISRQEDIRRTSSGDIRLAPEVVSALQTAARNGSLERTQDVRFTVAVGAAVPQQAGARPLPEALKQKVPSGNGMNYILAADRLILVDGRTQRIVAIVPGMG